MSTLALLDRDDYKGMTRMGHKQQGSTDGNKLEAILVYRN